MLVALSVSVCLALWFSFRFIWFSPALGESGRGSSSSLPSLFCCCWFLQTLACWSACGCRPSAPDRVAQGAEAHPAIQQGVRLCLLVTLYLHGVCWLSFMCLVFVAWWLLVKLYLHDRFVRSGRYVDPRSLWGPCGHAASWGEFVPFLSFSVFPSLVFCYSLGACLWSGLYVGCSPPGVSAFVYLLGCLSCARLSLSSRLLFLLLPGFSRVFGWAGVSYCFSVLSLSAPCCAVIGCPLCPWGIKC